MKRWLVALIVGSATVVGARMIMLPRVPTECGGPASWDVIRTCLAKHGDVELDGDEPAAKLVRLGDKQGTHASRELGSYLYLERDHKWRIAGMYNASSHYAVKSLAPVTIDKLRGWRFDLDFSDPTSVDLDGVTGTPAVDDRTVAVFCSGIGYRCASVMTACDVLVHGKAYWSFRGKLEIKGRRIKVAGDRSNAGSMCSAPSEIEVSWPTRGDAL